MKTKVFYVIGNFTTKDGKTKKIERHIKADHTAGAISTFNTKNKAVFAAETSQVETVYELKYSNDLQVINP